MKNNKTMKQIIPFLLLIFLCKTTSAQQIDSINFIVKANTKVPRFITDKKLSGCVFIYFKISAKGVISIVRIDPVFINEKKALVKFDFTAVETEAVRIFNILPKDLLIKRKEWSIERGDTSNFIIPINFNQK
jgi:hypothetical protein